MALGRPSSYRAEYAEQARKICLLGATDEFLANFFGISVATVNKWKEDHPDFSEALKDGKDRADAEVANSLYRRALGYSCDAVKIVTVSRSSDPAKPEQKTVEHDLVAYREHYPPDTTACIFWLKNRQKHRWRDKHDVEHGGADGGPIQVSISKGDAAL